MKFAGRISSRREFLTLVASGTAAISLASCGRQATGSKEASSGSSGGDQVLNVLFPQTHAGASETLKAGFEKKTGATVNVTLVPYEDLQQKATLDVQSGAANFDVFDSWYVTLGALAAGGVIAPLDGIIESGVVKADDFIQSIYDPYSLYDGKRWGLPFDGDTQVLFYNKKILQRNGVQPPTTWDEYATAVAKITAAEKRDGVYGAAVMAQKAPIILVGTFANRLAGFGGAFLDGGVPQLDSDAAIAAAEALVKVLPDALTTPSETAFDQALGAFLGGNVGFMEFWTDLGVFAQDKERSKIVDNWGVVQLPTGGSATAPLAALDAGFCMNISSAAPNPELAREFVIYATSQETNNELITTTGSGIDPNRVSTLNGDEYKSFAPQVQVAASASLKGALAWPTVEQSPALLQTLTDALANMVIGKGDAATTMKAVQADWEKTLG